MFIRRKVFITGAGRGLGNATAQSLAHNGAHVFVTGLPSEEKELKQLAKECGDSSAWAICDVRSIEQVQSAMEQANSCMGGIDDVICNAGVARQMVIDDPKFLDELAVTLAVNITGSANTAIAALPYMTEGGYIFFMSSLAGYVSAPMIGSYNASKAAVRAFAETLRVELKPRGIKVGVGVFSELETEMTSIGFGTNAGEYLVGVRLFGRSFRIMPVAKSEPAVKAIAKAIRKQRRNVDYPRRVRLLRLHPWVAQRTLEFYVGPRMNKAHEKALAENSQRTTVLPPTP